MLWIKAIIRCRQDCNAAHGVSHPQSPTANFAFVRSVRSSPVLGPPSCVVIIASAGGNLLCAGGRVLASRRLSRVFALLSLAALGAAPLRSARGLPCHTPHCWLRVSLASCRPLYVIDKGSHFGAPPGAIRHSVGVVSLFPDAV